MSDSDLSPEDFSADDLLAAEYVVGVLSAEDRARVQRRIATEPAFAADVDAWEARLTPMLAEVPAETPPRVVWLRIAAQLGVKPRVGAGEGLWRSLNLWRGASAVFAAAAAAAVMALVLAPPRVVVQPAPSAAGPSAAGPSEVTSVALLKGETGPAAFVVTFDREDGRMIITPVTATTEADRSFELWLLPDGQAPISLGVVNGEKALILRPDQLRGPDGSSAALAITVEPLGGAPNGVPTGPVVASGQLQPI